MLPFGHVEEIGWKPALLTLAWVRPRFPLNSRLKQFMQAEYVINHAADSRRD